MKIGSVRKREQEQEEAGGEQEDGDTSTEQQAASKQPCIAAACPGISFSQGQYHIQIFTSVTERNVFQNSSSCLEESIHL